MLTRIITAVVALAVFVAVLMAPPIVFTFALGAVILVMLWECYTATKADTATKIVGFVSAILMMCTSGVGMSDWSNSAFMTIFLIIAITISILLYMVLVVFKHGKKTYQDIISSGFLTFYIVISMGSVWFAKEMYSISMMLLIFVCAWSTDTFAYFTGCLCGKHKLIPHVSPKKTIEGAIGGVIGATLMSLLYAFVADKFIDHNPLTYTFAIAFGIAGSVASQIGDLIASSIKRDAGIKDFGWIFPGHGGFMDRFDSVMLAAPVFQLVYILAMFTSGIID